MGPEPPHCRGFTITLRHLTRGRNPLDEWSARRRDLYQHNTQHLQDTDIHAPGVFRTHNPSNLAAAGTHLRQRGRWCRGGIYLSGRHLEYFIYISIFLQYKQILPLLGVVEIQNKLSLLWQPNCAHLLFFIPLTQELNPSVQLCLTRFFTGDFASWTLHFVNICMKNQQMQQLFIQFTNYVW
jgi:cellulose synthase/poly-beta-1,6-N-acetylglucosamine synthase-like glycosyltransferase